MQDLHERIKRDLGPDDRDAPLWRLHLPSGEEFRIRLIGVEGPLVRFAGFWSSGSTVDFALVAPEAVVVTLETVERATVDDYVPVEFEDPEENTEADDVDE